MAKQRHFASADADLSKFGAGGPDMRVTHSLSGRKSISSWLVFAGLTALLLLVFFFNVFQFEFISSLYLFSPMTGTSISESVREPEYSCEYRGGPIFYNLKTSLGVSYEGSHW